MVMCSFKACASVALLLVLALFASETNAQSSDAPVAADAAEPSVATDGAAAAQPTVDLGYARYRPTAINVSLLQDFFPLQWPASILGLSTRIAGILMPRNET